MKTVLLSTLAAAVIALSAGTALASDASHDDGFAVFLQSQGKAPARSFLSGADYPTGTDNGWAVYQENAKVPAKRSFAVSVDYAGSDNINSANGRDAVEFRKTQEQSR
jgi:hypothetical protein